MTTPPTEPSKGPSEAAKQAAHSIVPPRAARIPSGEHRDKIEMIPDDHRERLAAVRIQTAIDSETAALTAEVARLRENNTVREALASAQAQNERLRKALEEIAAYDKDSKFGDGICPYGCDTPHIARAALGAKEDAT